jgi:hypothetical protein
MAEQNRFPVQITTLLYQRNKITIYYPQVVGVDKGFVQEKMNRDIRRLVNSLVKEQATYQVKGDTEMTGLYEIKTNERNVLSLNVENFAYTYPMAHGMTLLKSLTFDVQTGKSYSLRELFKPRTDYVQRINELIKAQLAVRDLPLLAEFTSIRPDQDFYIADKVLVIYFQLYEITPYAAGFPMFPISVYDLSSIVDEESPLGRMLAN